MSAKTNEGISIPNGQSHIHLDNVRTYCDICRKKMAIKYFMRGEENFLRYLRQTKYKDTTDITIIGICEDCLRKDEWKGWACVSTLWKRCISQNRKEEAMLKK